MPARQKDSDEPARPSRSGGLVTTKAIVISSLKYSEADLIVKCFTQSDGLKPYILRNILKSKKGKLRASMFQVLTQLEIVANHKNKGGLEYIREAKITFPYQTLHESLPKISMAFFLSEILKNSIQEEEANQELYSFLENSFLWLDHHGAVSNFHLLFMLKLTRFLGFYPSPPSPPRSPQEEDDSLSHKNKPVFNLLEGVFQETSTNAYCVEGENSFLLKTLLGLEYEGLQSLKLSQKKRIGFLEMLLGYYELHLPNFKKPKSLEVLNAVFS